MKRKLLSILIILSLLNSMAIPVYAEDTSLLNRDWELVGTYTVELNPGESAAVPCDSATLECNEVYEHSLGTLTDGQWIQLAVSSNSRNYKVTYQLYTDYGNRYASYTQATGNMYWQVGVTAEHSILFLNENSLSTTITYSIYKS